MKHWSVLVFLVVLSFGQAVVAVQPDEILDDSVLEQRARALSADLRCLVCQNQSIDDSDAPLARDLRLLLRDRLVAGDSDTEAIDYIVDRYGDYVLLKPPFNLSTLLLWATPLLALLAGILLIVVILRRRVQVVPTVEPELSAAEKKRLKAILERAT
ncbi:MAG: cytochrome c-type biogenesis protein CcmH [Alphaproteobacteria bacterium]|jgi:cytochrome c-type biogenesis protein CcmH|nr:cytochrome c-type biogenesis protein CcmH [Rhodospirillaceae bacterium]MBT6510762.1 cytochrome c-type biogenesis protein CcmH [Rhodospirillaceae bacterium]MBT7648171.1 cytochrome c-type biogenesis protein CcmH [Rhodospirillaceae bacterium]MDG2480045.1 cytochrome c-type biogenesis protein CcmH [Alphaproteobacteria bacterium]